MGRKTGGEDKPAEDRDRTGEPARDTTKSNDLEEEVRRIRASFTSIVEKSTDGILVVDSGGVVRYANHLAAQFLGRSVGEVVGEQLGKPLAAGDRVEVSLVRPGGEPGTGEMLVTATDWLGEPANLVVLRDVTERRRMEEAIRRTQKFESLGFLAGGIAHDFNNMLTGILGNIQLARFASHTDPQVEELLAQAEAAAMRATGLTRQLLAFSERGTPARRATSMAGLLEETVRFALSGSRCKCEFQIVAGLWPGSVDERQMGQAIESLVINASQSMPSGGTIRVRAENVEVGGGSPSPLPGPVEPGRYVRIEVIDEGVGIARENLERIFDPFFTTKHTGSGLGLTAAYSIVRKHGGHIGAESELGRGTKLTVYLPAAAEAESPGVPEEVLRPSSGRGRILVMDDEEIVRDLAENMLKRLGYEVRLACDGEEALEAYRAAREAGTPFDAVILDLTVRGGLGGEQTIQKLVEIDPAVRGIVSSGYSDDPVMVEFERHGFRGAAPKPYQLSELVRILRDVLSKP